MEQPVGIKLKNLCKVYPSNFTEQLTHVLWAAFGFVQNENKGIAALSDLTLDIHKGERIGIIGPNGAGKSTLLQIIAGVALQTSGSVDVSGQVNAILTIGTGLRDDLTGRANIYLDLEARGQCPEKFAPDVEAIIKFAALDKFIDLPVRTYSTGMRARLSFALATHIDPEILIVDEALSVGDAEFSEKARARISDLCSKGAIVLIVSHTMTSVIELCNRCIWLDQGKIVMDGSPKEVTQSYIEWVKSPINDTDHENGKSGVSIFNEDFKLSLLTLKCNGVEVSYIESGEELTLSFSWAMGKTTAIGKFVIRCFGLGGILVFENTIGVEEASAATGSANKIKIVCPKFNVAPGVYIFRLCWQDELGTMRAQSAVELEVIAQHVPIGGKPVLLNVGETEIVRVS